MLIKVHFAIIAAIFDYNPKVSVAMKSEYWEKCMPAVEKILDMLAEDTDDIATGEAIADEDESFEAKPLAWNTRVKDIACKQIAQNKWSFGVARATFELYIFITRHIITLMK